MRHILVETCLHCGKTIHQEDEFEIWYHGFHVTTIGKFNARYCRDREHRAEPDSILCFDMASDEKRSSEGFP